MISSDSATATRTWTATCAERLPGLDMTSPKFASEAARPPIRSDHSFEFYFNRLSRRIPRQLSGAVGGLGV
jgi:hypothetical protein